jgi:hypothetical protein
MANTTNYNWETPDDTDLVKDGAAAIRTLGSSIDTTTKNLNPETTLGDIAYRSATANTNTRLAIGSNGQVLTVAGGVPTWATSDDANAIQNAIVDAKGDIVAASAADTPARLAVGTDNQRLVAASGETTGLKYVSDTQNTVIDAEGDLLVGDAADALQRLAIGSNAQVLTVDTSVDGKIKWATPAGGGGKVLQVVSATSSTSTSSSTNSFVDITDVTATITPSASTSKILVLVSLDWRKTSGSGETSADFKLLRGATAIVNSNDFTLTEASEYATSCWSINYYDSPSTTSATTYKMQFRSRNNTASIQVGFLSGNSQQSITLLEIGA